MGDAVGLGYPIVSIHLGNGKGILKLSLSDKIFPFLQSGE